jgi:hypothetical protein
VRAIKIPRGGGGTKVRPNPAGFTRLVSRGRVSGLKLPTSPCRWSRS